MKSTVWHHLNLCPHGDPDKTISGAAIAVLDDGMIAWLGSMRDLPTQYATCCREAMRGEWVTPGLVDCHTHLLYGWQRYRDLVILLAVFVGVESLVCVAFAAFDTRPDADRAGQSFYDRGDASC